MDYPEWYPDWRSEAFEELKSKNAQLEHEYGIGSGGRYHYDLPTASLVFHTDRGTSVADIEVVGTTSGAAAIGFGLGLIPTSAMSGPRSLAPRECSATGTAFARWHTTWSGQNPVSH